jgi:hypothetical protein
MEEWGQSAKTFFGIQAASLIDTISDEDTSPL